VTSFVFDGWTVDDGRRRDASVDEDEYGRGFFEDEWWAFVSYQPSNGLEMSSNSTKKAWS